MGGRAMSTRKGRCTKTEREGGREIEGEVRRREATERQVLERTQRVKEGTGIEVDKENQRQV